MQVAKRTCVRPGRRSYHRPASEELAHAARRLMRGPGIAAGGILIAAAMIHFYRVFGGTFGKVSAIPSKDGVPVIQPSGLGTAIVGLALIAAACLVAIVAGLIQPPTSPTLFKSATACLILILGMRTIGDFRYVGFFKRVRGSRFATLDTLVYSPLCLVLAVLIGAAMIL